MCEARLFCLARGITREARTYGDARDYYARSSKGGSGYYIDGSDEYRPLHSNGRVYQEGGWVYEGC